MKEPWIAHDLTLSGKYACLEPMQAEHSEALGLAAADGELWNLKFTGVPTIAGMPEMVEKAIEKRCAGTEFPFVVRRQSDQKIVGATRYYFLSQENRNLSIGYTWYAKSAQRTSINTECKLMLLRYAFEQLSCISVAWHTDNLNHNSQAAIQKLGAKFEGVLRNHKIMPDGRIRHTHCFSMLDTEWRESEEILEHRLNKYN